MRISWYGNQLRIDIDDRNYPEIKSKKELKGREGKRNETGQWRIPLMSSYPIRCTKSNHIIFKRLKKHLKKSCCSCTVRAKNKKFKKKINFKKGFSTPKEPTRDTCRHWNNQEFSKENSKFPLSTYVQIVHHNQTEAERDKGNQPKQSTFKSHT